MKANIPENFGNQTKTILLVDDHTLFREGLKLLLKESPVFKVAGEAGTIVEGCDKAYELKPDIVLMDIALSDHSGIDVEFSAAIRPPG